MHPRHVPRFLLGAFALVVLLAALMIYRALPPAHLVLLAGAPTTSYADFAARYREQLHRHGVTLEIRSTGGSLANLEAIRDPNTDADLALTVTGLASATDAQQLYSLGGVSRGALWIFYRHDPPIDRVSDMLGMRISTGAPGSSINASVHSILTEGGALVDPAKAIQLSEPDAIAALSTGAIDAMFLTGLPDSQAVRAALQLPGVRLMSVAQASAIAQRDKTITAVVLPRGSVDLKRDIPSSDVTLLAASSSLIARRDLHPALQYLMLEVAKDTHREPDIFQKYGEFPAPQARDLPLSPYAERFYRNGRPFLFDYLPFWLAAFADRAMWIGLPLLALLLPTLPLATQGFYWLVGRQLRRCIRDLRALEREVRDNQESTRTAEYLQRLDVINQSVRSLMVPEALMTKVSELHGVIDRMQRDLNRLAKN